MYAILHELGPTFPENLNLCISYFKVIVLGSFIQCCSNSLQAMIGDVFVKSSWYDVISYSPHISAGRSVLYPEPLGFQIQAPPL